jgi:hypothetical protein
MRLHHEQTVNGLILLALLSGPAAAAYLEIAVAKIRGPKKPVSASTARPPA